MFNRTNRSTWGTQTGFILAAAGSAVGLGNIWAFPTRVGQSGGAAFVLIYLICVALICFPIMLSPDRVAVHIDSKKQKFLA